MRDLGTVRPEGSDAARKRRRREYDEEVDDRALDLIQNDPEVEGDMRKAKRKARELIAIENSYNAGELDPESDPPAPRSRARTSPSGRARTRGVNRSAKRNVLRSSVRKTARTVVAPFGSAASAGWTLFQGGLSLVLLYVVLRDADAISAFVRGITGGFKRFGDPYTPLIPTKGESSPPRARPFHPPPSRRQPQRRRVKTTSRRTT
jgi:hypothetical protein